MYSKNVRHDKGVKYNVNFVIFIKLWKTLML